LGDAAPLFDRSRRPAIKNCILTALSLSDFDCLRGFLQPVQLERGRILSEANRAIEYVTFVESGLVSQMTLTSGSMLETAMVGRHGAVDASIAFGVITSLHKSIVLVPGSALRIPADDLLRSINKRPQIREHLLRYVRSLMIHSSQTALCGVHHELERRLASWLCLACDILEGETLTITHDHLSFILGVRRSGVTETLARFEELGAIRKARGFVQVRERRLLEQRACNCHGSITAAYRRTMLSPIECSSVPALIGN
jgi:CRP-like cAMP-binding protein